MQLGSQPKEEPRENVLPLINVVFLLLIFFMLTGAFTDPELFAVSVPTAANDNKADQKVLTVLMSKNGELAFKNSIISQNKLGMIIDHEVENNSLVHLQLKADASVDAVRLVEIMELLNNTGLRSLHLITTFPES